MINYCESIILLMQVSNELCYISCCSTCSDETLSSGNITIGELRKRVAQEMYTLFKSLIKELPIPTDENPGPCHWIQHKLIGRSYSEVKKTITTELKIKC